MITEVQTRYNEVRSFIFRWLTNTLPGYPIIMDNQHDPRPKDPHVSFNYLTGFRKVSNHDERISKGSKIWLSCLREFTITIRAIGSPINGAYPTISPLEMLDALQSSLDLDINIDSFRNAGLSVVECLGVINTTALEDNVFRPSGVLDVILRTRYMIDQTPGFIEQVDLSGVIHNPGREDIEVGPFVVSV